MRTKKIIALLPMKGHSERVPNKNLKVIAGQPLCLWVLKTLINVPEISKIIINTDSDKISNLCSISNKITINVRPKSLIGDLVSMNKIIDYDISRYEGDFYIQTHATNPLLQTATVQSAIDKYIQSIPEYDSLFSVTTLHTRLYDAKFHPINHDPNNLVRTQDLPPVYEENSNFYIFSKNSFYKNNRRIGNKPYLFEIPSNESVDIDELLDFEIADFLLRKKHGIQNL